MQYNWTRTYSPYVFSGTPTAGAQQIQLSSTADYTYNVTRTFEKATWYPQKSVVSYYANYTMKEIPNEETLMTPANNATYDMINFGGLDVWYQMVNKPKFFKAWQAMTQVYEFMLQSDYVNRIYAYNALQFFFKDEDQVKQYVMPNLDTASQETLYTDEQYGLGTSKGLAAWSAVAMASKTCETDANTQVIVDYFAGLDSKVTLDTTQVKLICGNGSMLRSITL